MGGKESKQFPISYDEALKRVTEAEKRRLQDAFRRLSASSGHISRQLFIKEVVGDALPSLLADQIYSLCNGGHHPSTNGNGANSSAFNNGVYKGLNFREVLAYLVLITRGTREEKIKFIYGLFASESGAHVEKSEMIKHVKDWENGFVPESVMLLFSDSDKVTFEEFFRWIDVNAENLGISRWLLFPNPNLSLINKTDTPTFYQTLAGVTHLEELEVVELEKRFWELASHSASNQIDLVTITPMISPPLPNSLVAPFFAALDENEDGHIDFKELSCGMSAACRGPEMERQKFCFKIFDRDKDGQLNRSEISTMLQSMMEIRNQSLNASDRIPPNVEPLLNEILNNGKVSLSIEDYLVWTTSKHKELPAEFAKLIYQLCHVVLGLRPPHRQAEGEIVRGWLDREEKAALHPGQVWYLLNIDWWHQWNSYVNFTETLTKKTKQLSLESSTENSQVDSMTENHGLRPPETREKSSSSSSTPVHSPHPSRKNVHHRPGLIDNSNLIQSPSHKITSLTGEGGRLKPSLKLIRGKDFELIPERLWKALIEWYGGAPAIPRQVIRNHKGEVELELHPLSIKLYKHQTVPRQTNHVPTVVGGYSAAAIHATGANFSGFGGNSNLPTTYRRYHAHQAAFSRRTTVFTIENFLCQRFNTKSEDLRLWHFKDDSHMSLLIEASSVLEEIGIKEDDAILVEVRSRDGTWPEEISSLVTDRRTSTAASLNSAVLSVPGITGLNNLGNTCYMNAALQCVSNTKILAQYFQKNCHLHELNRTNPLGFHGHVAKRFGDLVRDMWSTSSSKTIAPIKMRWTISRYSQNFSGFQQHDSQELLAFLLDGLHEDLNRVMIKPYDELKDSDGRPDDVVAAEAWDNHIRRNQSVIVDLYHGQLKSKVTCKVCGHESVKFDPFTYLSLPLPMESSIHLEVIVIRQNGSVPVKYGLTLDMEAKYSDIKPRLSRLSKVPADNLILVDIIQSQFRAQNTDEQKLKGLNGSCIFAYEFRSLLAGARNSSIGSEQAQSLSDIQRGTVSPLNEETPKRGQNKPLVNCDSSKNDHSELGGNGKSQNQDDSEDRIEEVKLSLSNDSSKDESTLLNGNKPAIKEQEVKKSPPSAAHSRQSSQASTASMDMRPSRPTVGLGDCHKGLIVGLHRKMMPQEVYFLSTEKYRPVIFGLPLIIPCGENTTYQDIYQTVWTQVSRLVSPLPPRDSSTNHATDCDDSLGYEYPFVLKVVQEGGSFCAWCPWHRFCRGCELPCTTAKNFAFCASYIAIDWDQTALHLRYLSNQEKAFEEDASVELSLKAATEPITLKKCLEAFTRAEELGENEKYYCSACKKRQLASKKLQIWRLPPILIVHLKRFHFVNGRWIKSHKIVDFPNKEFDPTDYLAAIPQQTIKRHRELVSLGSRVRSTILRSSRCNGTITEASEGESSITDQGSSMEDEEEVEEKKYQNLDDSAVGQSDSSGLVASLDDEEDEDVVFENEMKMNNVIFSPSVGRRRSRQQSTSLMRHPIEDDNLKDYHEHRMEGGKDPFDISYSLYSVICHSGVLGGGHYISYSKSTTGKWYCQNDSACKEFKEEDMEKGNAYMLFYERENLSVPEYLPKIDSKLPPDTKDLEDELEVDFKKHCSLM